MKIAQSLILPLAIILLGACGKREQRSQEITFVNKTDGLIEAHGFISELNTEDDCKPYENSKVYRVKPDETYTMKLSIKCRGSSEKGAYAVLVKPYDIVFKNLTSAQAVSKLKPGFQFEVVNSKGDIRTLVTVVSPPEETSHKNPWTYPPNEQASVAWIKNTGEDLGLNSWGLFISLPKGTEAQFVAFPKSSGLKELGGNFSIFEKDGFYMSSVNFLSHGPSVPIELPKEKVTVTCDLNGCLSK